MSGYWICHQCGQRVPAGQVELHNIQHLTRGNTQRNGGASPAEMAAFLTLLFSLIAWVLKTLYKFIVVIFKFCKRRPRLALELAVVAVFVTALIISNPSIFSNSNNLGERQEQKTTLNPQQHKTVKNSKVGKSKSRSIPIPGSTNEIPPEVVVPSESAVPISTTPTEYFQWPPTISSQVATQEHTLLTGVNWKPMANAPHWYTYTEPQWEWCGGGSSQCEKIWWVSDKYCSGASPLAQYTLDGITHSSPGWHGSATPFIAVLGLYELPGNTGGDRSLQSRFAIFEPVSISCRTL